MSQSCARQIGGLAACAVLAMCSVAGCARKEPVRIGFVAQLTGVQAELGVQERNGVYLALEDINAAGGIAGRPIELIVRDDLGTAEGAQTADRALVQAHVVAVVGHTTSAQTIAGLAVTEPARVVMLSPSASSSELRGKHLLFRLAETLEGRAHHFARHVFRDRKLVRMVCIYDTDNSTYTKSYLNAFAAEFRALGGDLVAQTGFSSKAQVDVSPLLEWLRARRPDGLLIVAADVDTAIIAQRTRLMGWPVPLFTSAWAQTETLIRNGGQAVDGMELEITSAFDDELPAYVRFKSRYQARFGRVPSFGAILGYEAAQVLAAALQRTGGKPEGLPQAFTGIGKVKGLRDTLSFDESGGVVRPVWLGTIQGGKYVSFEHAKP